MNEIALAVDRIYRKEAGRLLAFLLSKAGRDFQLAEDALHDSIGKAIQRWSADGIPENPVGWLTITARNYAINEMRKRALHSRNVEDLEYLLELQKESENPDPGPFPDERLRMIFTCCH
jgi:RNA polymerase sigma-70 factor (ECF subfamily)